MTRNPANAFIETLLVVVLSLPGTASHAADRRIDSIASPVGTLRAIWIEHRFRCHKTLFKTSAIGSSVVCNDDIVDVQLIEPATDGLIVFPKPWTVTGPPWRFLGLWTEPAIDVIAYGAGWSGYFATRAGRFITPWKPEDGPPRFVPDNRATYSTMPLADRRTWGIEIAALGIDPLFNLSGAQRQAARRFVDDLYYLLAERLADPGISAESRTRLETHFARLNDLVRFWQLDTPPAEVVHPDVSVLAQELGDQRPWLRWRAALALGRAGAPAVEPLRTALRSTDRQTQIAAALALERIGPPASAAVPDLAGRLGDSDRNVRHAATAALVTTIVPGAANEETMAALVALLGDADPDVGLFAAEALGRCGPSARAAEPGLKKLLNSGDPDARLAALHALGQIDPHDDELIAADIAALNAPDDTKRQHAMTAIAAFGAAAVPRLTSALSGPEQGATAAAETLGRIGPSAASAVPALSRLLDDPRRYVRRCAVRALGQIGPPAGDAVPALLALLQDNARMERDEDRREVIQALGGIGPAAAPAVPTLATLVRNGGEVGADAAKALGGIGPAAAPAIPDLSLALHSWPFYRDALPIVLGKIGSEQGVPALVDALSESSLAMNCAALAALTLIGPKAIPPLETALGAVPTSDSADDANRRYKIQAAIKQLRTGNPAPVECRTIFAELRLR